MKKIVRRRGALMVMAPMALLIVPIQPAQAVGACEVIFMDATASCTAGSTFNSCYNAAAAAYVACLQREATVHE